MTQHHEPVPSGRTFASLALASLALASLAFASSMLAPSVAQALEPPAQATASLARTELPAQAGLAPTSPALARGEVVAEAPQPDQRSDEEPSPPFVDLTVATHVPLSVGAAVTVELPGRILLQLDVGGVPSFVGSLGGAFIGAVGFNHPNIALAAGAFEGTVVARGSAGWRPFSSAGFEVTGGYTFISLSGSVTPQELADAAGGSFPPQVMDNLDDIALTSQLHNFHLAVGWRWLIAEHFVLRANLGYTQTVASSSEVEIPGLPAIEARANPAVDAQLDDIYRSYFKLPVLSLAAGYRF